MNMKSSLWSDQKIILGQLQMTCVCIHVLNTYHLQVCFHVICPPAGRNPLVSIMNQFHHVCVLLLFFTHVLIQGLPLQRDEMVLSIYET